MLWNTIKLLWTLISSCSSYLEFERALENLRSHSAPCREVLGAFLFPIFPFPFIFHGSDHGWVVLFFFAEIRGLLQHLGKGWNTLEFIWIAFGCVHGGPTIWFLPPISLFPGETFSQIMCPRLLTCLAISAISSFKSLIFYSPPLHEPFQVHHGFAFYYKLCFLLPAVESFWQFPDGCYVVEHHRDAAWYRNDVENGVGP